MLVNGRLPNRYNHEIYKLYQKGVGDTYIKNKIWDAIHVLRNKENSKQYLHNPILK
jgi:hypothetical protein